jgi:tetratricopeptide (TPR) repeat protein
MLHASLRANAGICRKVPIAFRFARGALLSLSVLIGMSVTVVAVAVADPIRLADLYAALDEIAPHARAYPPSFSTPAERVQTEKRLKSLLAELDKISIRYPNDKDILFIRGAANAMGYNLDYPGCAEKAMAAFDRLLTIDPDNRRALYEYGGFLSGTTLLDQATAYLNRAVQLGEERAHYTLAFVYLKKGDTQSALAEFNAYLKIDPENAVAKRHVADIRSGSESVHIIRHDATQSP